MKNTILGILSLLLLYPSFSQETVFWASEVIDVSSQYAPFEYSAVQALNRPNVLPAGGPSPNAWRPKKTTKEEFIVVSFDTPVKAKQIAIAESENPGAVKKVVAYDTEYNDYVLFELTPRELPIESRLLNLFFETSFFEIEAIKVVLAPDVGNGFHSIDAIGLSSSNIPINVLINAIPNVNESLSAESLSENVNSQYEDKSPIVSPDGKRLYFSRQFHPDNVGGINDPEDIWFSEIDEETGEWLPAKNLGGPLNNKGPNFISSINMVDGEEVFVLGNRYGRNGRMFTGVSISRRLNGQFTPPEALDIENDYNYSPNSDFFLIPGGEALILSAERDDTFGSRDLYISFLNENGSWSEPQNLGEDINSFGEEKSPFLADDGKTLYFSSNGYSGYGGQDIYVSFKIEEGNWFEWTEPENLGAGVNKAGDDEYLSVPSSGTQLYFTRTGDGDNTDIFTFNVESLFVEGTNVADSRLASSLNHLIEDPSDVKEETLIAIQEEVADSTAVTSIDTVNVDSVVVAETEPIEEIIEPTPPIEEIKEEVEEVLITINGRVLDVKDQSPVANSVVQVQRLPDGIIIGEVTTNESGYYQFSVKPGARYAIVGESGGFISQSENFDLNDQDESIEINKDLFLAPIEKGEKIVINNIFFDFDKTELKTSSYPELNRILDYLKSNKIQKILLTGHTDSVGNPDYNTYLSGMRAKSVMDFFLKNGVSKSSVSYEALGQSKPIASNDTAEGRAKNRRVEFEIVE